MKSTMLFFVSLFFCFSINFSTRSTVYELEGPQASYLINTEKEQRGATLWKINDIWSKDFVIPKEIEILDSIIVKDVIMDADDLVITEKLNLKGKKIPVNNIDKRVSNNIPENIQTISMPTHLFKSIYRQSK